MPNPINFVTHCLAVGDGLTDNGPMATGGNGAVTSFNTQALAAQGSGPNFTPVTLNIPSGNFLIKRGALWCQGIHNLTIQGGFGGGTTKLFTNVTFDDVDLGGPSLLDNTTATGKSFLIDNVSAGSLSVTCLTNTDVNNFSSGDYVLLYGVDLQLTSWPPNPQVYEFAQVASVDAPHGKIFLTSPIKYGYSKNWPNFTANGAGVNDPGPAKIMRPDDNWNCIYDIHDLTIGDGTTQSSTSCHGRNVTLTNCIFSFPTGNFGFDPSCAINLTVNNCSQTTSVGESDKCVGAYTVNGGTWHTITVQSASVGDPITLSGVTVTPGDSAAAASGVIANSSLQGLSFTPSSYGVCKKLTMTNTTVTSVSAYGSSENDIVTAANGWSVAAGVITCTKSQLYGVINAATGPSLIGWASPNYSASFGYNSGVGTAANLCGPPFLVTDIVDNGATIDIHTNLGAGFNALPTVPGASRIIWQHPCADIAVSGCSGDTNEVLHDLGHARCQHRPLGKVSVHDYLRGDYNSTNKIYVFGKIVSVKVDVTQRYTGTGTMNLHVFGASGLNSVNSSGGTTNINPTVDVTVGGPRYIYPGSVVTVSGNDSLTAVGYAYIPSGKGDISNSFPQIRPSLDAALNLGIGPEVTIEIITDQAWLPTINSITPNSGLAGTSVVIDGHSFHSISLSGTDTAATSVTFGGVAASFTVVDDFTITATAPGGLTGTVDVVITTASGTSIISAADQFTYPFAPVARGLSTRQMYYYTPWSLAA